MDRADIAMSLLTILEQRCPGLVHSYDARYEHEDYSDNDVADIVVSVCEAWSREKWIRGEYKVIPQKIPGRIE